MPLLKNSLRVRVTLGIALPVLVLVMLLHLVHTWSERKLLEQEALQTAYQLQKLVHSSLRVSMIGEKKAFITGTLEEVLKIETIERIQILTSSGVVWRAVSEQRGENLVGQAYPLDAPECTTCHEQDHGKNVENITLPVRDGMLRVVSSFPNQPECRDCHVATTPHLGILMVDLALPGVQSVLSNHILNNLGFSLVSIVLITLGVYFLIDNLVVQRLQKLQAPIGELMIGDYSVRLPVMSSPRDEIDQLSQLVNQMAVHLQGAEKERAAQKQVREFAITQERERLAREIHDNTAQLLGFVINKAKAIQLLLARNRVESAKEQLTELEDAAQVLYTDTREIIAGLNVSYNPDQSLAEAIVEYIGHFSRLAPLNVQLEVPPEVYRRNVTSEMQLQILRIVQETLTNVRKHSEASHVKIAMECGENALFIVIEDNGKGFDPNHVAPNHFGILTMKARAMEIGAELTLESQPGFGTLMQIKIPLDGNI